MQKTPEQQIQIVRDHHIERALETLLLLLKSLEMSPEVTITLKQRSAIHSVVRRAKLVVDEMEKQE